MDGGMDGSKEGTTKLWAAEVALAAAARAAPTEGRKERSNNGMPRKPK